MSKDVLDHLWPFHLHPYGINGDNLRSSPFCCLFLSSLPSTSGHILPGSRQAPSHVRKQPSGLSLCVLHTQKAPRGLGAFPGWLLIYKPVRLRSAPCSDSCGYSPRLHILCLPRAEQEDWHLHDTRSGALAAGLKKVNHFSAGDFLGGVGEAAGGCGVNPTCGEARTTVTQEYRQAPEDQEEVERDSVAQSWGLGVKETGKHLILSFVCFSLISLLLFLVLSLHFGLYLFLQGTKPWRGYSLLLTLFVEFFSDQLKDQMAELKYEWFSQLLGIAELGFWNLPPGSK